MTDPINFRAALAEPPAVAERFSDEELLRIAATKIEPYDRIEVGEYEAENNCALEVYGSELIAFARAVLARLGQPPAPPAEGEVAALVNYLRGIKSLHCQRAAELLEHLARQTLPQGMIPMEYVDADSSARIVSEPSEDGPGGCWVVRNSRHVNPCTEFPTAEAAWDALQLHALPLPAPQGGEVG